MNDEPNDTRPRRLIYEMRERVQQVRNQYLRERVQGRVTQGTHRELAEVAVQYHDVLFEHREEGIVKKAWEEAGVDDIQTMLNETAESYQEAPGRSSAKDPDPIPAILTVHPQTLYRATKELDSLAKDLGFAAHVGDKVAELDDAVV